MLTLLFATKAVQGKQNWFLNMQMIKHYIHIALVDFGQLDDLLKNWQLLKEWGFMDDLQKCVGLL